MKFSVIIPVYNVEAYLRDCLDGVLNQTCTDWEAICVNDGSTDGSAVILNEYAARDSRLKVITQPNGGLSAARNAGIDAAEGEYVLFLDSDDWLEENALEVLSNNLDGEDMVCFSGRRYFEKEQRYNDADRLKAWAYASGMDYYNENALSARDFAFVCVVLRIYRREFLSSHNLKFKEGIFHEDNLFTPLACFYSARVKVINECLYDYRVRSNSITTTFNAKRLRDLLETANTLAEFFVQKKGFDKKVVYRAITHHYQTVFVYSIKEDRFEFGRSCDWSLYRIVSQTKLRHRLNYWKNRIRYEVFCHNASL